MVLARPAAPTVSVIALPSETDPDPVIAPAALIVIALLASAELGIDESAISVDPLPESSEPLMPVDVIRFSFARCVSGVVAF